MGLVISWSTTLLAVDAYSIFIKSVPKQRRFIFTITFGDMVCTLYNRKRLKRSHCFVVMHQIISKLLYQVLSYLLLGAACSTASVTDLLRSADKSYCPENLCSRYQISAAMAILAWFLSSASCLINFWLFPSLWNILLTIDMYRNYMIYDIRVQMAKSFVPVLIFFIFFRIRLQYYSDDIFCFSLE